MAARTLRSTSAEKRCVPLTNFETVEMETPAADAMSRMVSLLFIGCASIKESVFPRSPALCSARAAGQSASSTPSLRTGSSEPSATQARRPSKVGCVVQIGERLGLFHMRAVFLGPLSRLGLLWGLNESRLGKTRRNYGEWQRDAC